MSTAIDLTGRQALVTGASRGIGAAIARLLHAAGAGVALNHPGDAASERDANAIAYELNAARPASAVAIAADVADPHAVETMMRALRERVGPLDVLVNNAGILRDRTIAKMTLDEWSNVVDVNLSGVFYCCKFGLVSMNDGGAIVNIASLSAQAGFVGQSNYAAAKAGVEGLTRVLARECARRSIRVNAVAPGLVETSMAASIPETTRTAMRDAIPLKRFARPEEIAAAVLFLASPLASYVSGHVLDVNGGWRG